MRDDLLMAWRRMEDPPPKVPWPAEEDVEVEEYTSPPPHETKTISMRFYNTHPPLGLRIVKEGGRRLLSP